MKPVSIEEAIARIEKDIEENRIEPDDSVIRAVPTGPTTPIIPTDNGITRLQSEASLISSPTDPSARITPSTVGDRNRPLTLEELIEKLECETEESLYQEFCEKYTRISGETPNPTLSDIIKNLASIEYMRGQYLLNILKAPRVEMCPVEREQLDRYGELFEVAREAGESDESYRERIRQRAYPYST